MESEKINQARERFNKVENLVKEDKVAVGFLDKLVDSAVRYVGVVATMSAQVNATRDSENCFDERGLIETLDKERKVYHEGLRSNLDIFNRYLFKNFNGEAPKGGIYSLSSDSIKDRSAVKDWAGYFVFGLKEQGVWPSDICHWATEN